MAVFAAGLVSGALLVLTVQSRPAPAVPAEPAPSLSPPPIARAAPAATHPAEVLRVIDGDTFEARVHVWPGLDVGASYCSSDDVLIMEGDFGEDPEISDAWIAWHRPRGAQIPFADRKLG